MIVPAVIATARAVTLTAKASNAAVGWIITTPTGGARPSCVGCVSASTRTACYTPYISSRASAFPCMRQAGKNLPRSAPNWCWGGAVLPVRFRGWSQTRNATLARVAPTRRVRPLHQPRVQPQSGCHPTRHHHQSVQP